jgi:hypothetical protein
MPAPRLPVALIFVVTAMAAAQPPAASQWKPLFDGRSLAGWRATPFTNAATPRVENGQILLPPGGPLTGITWTAAFPATHYEIRFEAARLRGNDFFASLTFPAGGDYCTWVAGGWGGDIVGLSNIDGQTAADNETRSYFTFENARWYRFRLRVTPESISAWIDDERVIHAGIAGREISLRPGDIKLSAPLGFASFASEGAIRKAEFRLLPRGD